MRKLKITELNRISAEEFKQVEKLPLVVVLDDIDVYKRQNDSCIEPVTISETVFHRVINRRS